MTGIQYYRWATMLPGVVFLLAAIPMPGFFATSMFVVALASALGADQEAENVLGEVFLLALISPAVVAYLLVSPLHLWRIWRLPEDAYRKRSVLLPFGVTAAAVVVTVVVMFRAAGWHSLGLGLLVAVPTAIVCYAYLAVAALVLAVLRAASLVEEPTQATGRSSVGVIVAAFLSLAGGIALLAAAILGLSRGAAETEDPAAAEGVADTEVRATAEALEEDGAPTRLERRWSVEPGRWNQAVLFHPDGDVIALDSGNLFVLARDTGQILDTFDICALIKGGAAFLSDRRVALICREGVEVLELPGGARESVVPLDEVPEAGHAVGGLLVIGSGTRALLYDTISWELVEAFDLSGEVTAVALSPDAQQLAASSSAGLVLLDVKGGAGRKLLEGPSSTVAFSRDGATIFVAGEGFDAFTIDTSTGARKTAMRRSSWVEGAGFIDSNLLAVTGADGLVVYESSGRRVLEAREGSPATALAAEEGRVCAGARSGAVTCYSSEPLRPSSYTPTVAADRPESHTLRRARAAPEVPVEPVGTQRGTLESASGSELVVRSVAAGPPVGTTGRLAKRVKMPLGGDTMIWVEIARVKVTGTEGDRVWLEVLEERTVLSVNDQKHDYFTPGSQVRLEW